MCEEMKNYMEDDMVFFYEETLFGKVTSSLSVGRTERIGDAFNKKAKLTGFKILSSISRVPLSRFWQTCSEIFLVSLFLANVILMSYDLYIAPIYLFYKGISLGLVLLKNWLLGRWHWSQSTPSSPKFNNSANKDQLKKVQQYTGNILHELLLAPLLIVTTIGIDNDNN